MIKTRCKTTAQLQVSDNYTKTLSFSHEQVARYCELTGDHNAIHRKLEAARLRFPDVPDIVVPGGLIQTSVSGIFGSEFPGDGAIGLSFVPERFRKPVCPGDEILVSITITRIRGPLLEVDIIMTLVNGDCLTTAKAKIMAADDVYQVWWQKQQ